MRQGTGLVLIVAALFATGCGATTASHKLHTEQTTGPGAAASSGAAATATAAPKPTGKVGGSCDMLLNSNFSSSIAGWLVASVQVRNTGNVGIKVNAKAAWQQAGSASIVRVSPLRVRVGGRKSAHFRIPISQNQVSAFQSAPGYDSGNTPCGIDATITGTFGKVH